MIRRHRRDAAPIIEPGADQRGKGCGREVGRRLDVHRGAEDQPCHGDGPEQLLESWLRRRGGAGAGLGAEVLDDDFLDVAVAAMQLQEPQQRLDALGAGLADADEDAGGEGNAPLAGEPDGLEPRRRMLVGRAVMHLPRRHQPLGSALQHQPHRHRHRPQQRQIVVAHDPGIDMRQQPGLGHHRTAHLGEVGDGAGESQRGQRLGGGAVAQLRLVAEREEGLLAAGGRAGTGNGEDLVLHEVGRAARTRPLGKGAVMADVAAELGERDEDLARIGDEPRMGGIAQRRRLRHQRRQRQGQGALRDRRGECHAAPRARRRWRCDRCGR